LANRVGSVRNRPAHKRKKANGRPIMVRAGERVENPFCGGSVWAVSSETNATVVTRN